MRYKALGYLFMIIVFITSCSQPKPAEKEIVGIWNSLQDAATIELRKDYTVSITNYPLKLNNSNFKGNLNGTGTWKIHKDNRDRWWSVQISAKNDKIIPELYSDGIAIELLIARSGAFGNGSEIKNLFIWKGDPDADDRYEFKKKND